MMELTINGQVYEFNFGIGFLKDINSRVKQAIPGMNGVSKNVGLSYAVASIIDDDVEELINVLDLANKGHVPRVTRDLLGEYIDQPDTNINDLFEETLSFLSKSNATGRMTKKLIEAAEKAEAEE